MKNFKLVWSPSGKVIANVSAISARVALQQTPMPYSEYKGEVYVEEIPTLTSEGVVKLLKALGVTVEFKPFTATDWEAFSGCDSKEPYIANTENGLIIVDNDAVQVIEFDEHRNHSSITEVKLIANKVV